jgi:hypothetical protein
MLVCEWVNNDKWLKVTDTIDTNLYVVFTTDQVTELREFLGK